MNIQLRPQALCRAMCVLTLAAALVVICAPAAFAQEATAGITGTVTDPTGASVQNATVTARDVDRGSTFPTQTNSDGVYVFPRLPVGNYEVRVEASGFQTSVRPGITLQINQTARLDFTLTLGQ